MTTDAPLIVYRARRIITQGPAGSRATHIAVRDGRIAGVGTAQSLAALGSAQHSDRFADQVLVPGFVEGHAHADTGQVWGHTYCGQYERVDPQGRRWPALTDVEGVVQRLRQAADAHPDDGKVQGWGVDPIHLPRPLDRHDLDRVSTTRPVTVSNASGHILYLNTQALEQVGLLRPDFTHDGLPLGPDGLARGEVRGIELMFPAMRLLGLLDGLLNPEASTYENYARLCVMTGVTTVTDLASSLAPPTLAMLQSLTARPDWPVRLVPALFGGTLPPKELLPRALELQAASTPKLHLGIIKLVLDGSIQGFTARLRTPTYFNGAPNGLWYMAPERVREVLAGALPAGLHVHIHTNGDQASELALDLLEEAVRQHPGADHRTTLQHAQLMDAGLIERARRLGACANFFSNHLYYWGDAHAAQTVGPERAAQMNAAGTAQRLGLPFGIHSDTPVTPLGPLFTAWCAVNRTSSTGRVLGEGERLSVEQALHAITLGTAYTLGLENEVGSLEVGKRADFAVLDDDPLSVAPQALREIGVWGTVVGGRAHPARA